MYGPWSEEELFTAYNVPLLRLITHVAAFVREDMGYVSPTPFVGGRFYDITCYKRDIQLVLLGQQWHESGNGLDREPQRGMGAISLACYLADASFVRAVKICLDAHAAPVWEIKNCQISDDRDRFIEEAMETMSKAGHEAD